LLSELVDPLTLTSRSVRLHDNAGNWVQHSRVLEADGRTISVTPSAPLLAGERYYVYVGSYRWWDSSYRLYDLSGNQLNYRSFNFTVNRGEDLIAPLVSTATVSDGQTGVPTNVRMRIRLNEPVNGLTLAGIGLFDDSSNPVAVRRSLATDQVTVELSLPVELTANSIYSLQIAGVQDLAANTITDLSRSFTTGTGAETTLGSVTSTTPAHTATAVPLDTPIQIQFSKAADPFTVNSNSFRFYDQTAGQFLDGSRSLSPDGLTLSFIPDSVLISSRRYYLYSSYYGYLYDLAGNRFNSNNSYFNTQ